MRIGVIGLLALLLPAVAQAQDGKPPPVGAEAAPPAQASDRGQGQAEGRESSGRCAQPLASGCLAQQGACQVACPPHWSMNPGAPAFTPTDRAGCLGQCQQRYFACMRLHGCL